MTILPTSSKHNPSPDSPDPHRPHVFLARAIALIDEEIAEDREQPRLRIAHEGQEARHMP